MPQKQGLNSSGEKQPNFCIIIPGVYCICPNCGDQLIHRPGMPCYLLTCPQCGKKMNRGKVLFKRPVDDGQF